MSGGDNPGTGTEYFTYQTWYTLDTREPVQAGVGGYFYLQSEQSGAVLYSSTEVTKTGNYKEVSRGQDQYD